MVFTFGYKIRLVKKNELREYDLFEKSVYAIHQQCNDFGQWLYKGFDLDRNTANQLTVDIEGLSTFIDVYFNNMYSSPVNSMQMFKALDAIRKHSSNLIDIIGMSMKVNSYVKNINESEVDIDYVRDQYDEYRSRLNKQLDHEVDEILAGLKYITVVIEHDLIKLLLGVDIISEHKKRIKRIPKNKDLTSEFNIRFKVLTPSDRRFLEKEKMKNASK